jgi:phospholipid/cholesterol/gamma-HCH transport system permease protein
MALSAGASTPLRSLGEFFRMSWETLTLIPRRPFAWNEFLFQSWFVARVALLPTLLLAIPFTVLAVFTFNILLAEFGAADYSGVGAGEGGVTQIGPIVTVLVISGAGATAMCADLGARTIREEIDAMNSTHCASWASIRSSPSWCRACWPPRSSRSCCRPW